MECKDQAGIRATLKTTVLSLLLTLQLLLTELEAYEFNQDISFQAVVTPGSRGDNSEETKHCPDREVCKWTHYCEQTFYYKNNTATISCIPCYSVCKSLTTDDTCESLCPGEIFYQQITW